MYHRGDSLKARNIGEQRVGKRFVFVSVNTILDDVKTVFVFPVNLQIQIILSGSCDYAVERAFCDKSIPPSQRKDVLNRHIVQLDAGNIPRHDLTAFVDGLPNHTRNVRHSSER